VLNSVQSTDCRRLDSSSRCLPIKQSAAHPPSVALSLPEQSSRALVLFHSKMLQETFTCKNLHIADSQCIEVGCATPSPKGPAPVSGPGVLFSKDSHKNDRVEEAPLMSDRRLFGFIHVVAVLSAIAGFIPPLSSAAQTFTDLHDFVQYPYGAGPMAVASDAAGNFYGTTAGGGTYGGGVVFRLSPISKGNWTQTVVHEFQGGATDGDFPMSGVISDAAGNLYGTTFFGGPNVVIYHYYESGAVYQLSPNANGTWTETLLHAFTGTPDGANPVAGLTFDATGNLYGTTQDGGAYGLGTIFELSPNGQGGWIETILYSFTGYADGAEPLSSLLLDQAGNLYGTALLGGDINCFISSYYPKAGCGAVFELTRKPDGTWVENTLHSFIATDGAGPAGPLVWDSSGNLLGTTQYGPDIICNCGTVFRLSPSSSGLWSLRIVYVFAGGLDGANPDAGLLRGNDGSYYSTTQQGGETTPNCKYGCGTVFKLTPATGPSWKEKVLHRFGGTVKSFQGVNGSYPTAGVIFDSSGNLYGTASGGGLGFGTVFKLGPNSSGSWSTSSLYQFPLTHDGLSPEPGLAADSGGNLYGTSQTGGVYGQGSVFELVKLPVGGWRERVLYSFHGPIDGEFPNPGVILDGGGKIYGTTYFGGSSCLCGTVFELSPTSHGQYQERTLYAFQGGTDGAHPSTTVTLDGNGNLFGTTGSGGSSACGAGVGCGTVFELTPAASGWTEKVLYAFQDASDGRSPYAPLVIDPAGILYGISAGTLQQNGIIFQLAPNPSGSWVFSIRRSFSGNAMGGIPERLILDEEGNLYGTTFVGGASNLGVVFRLNKNNQLQVLHSFTGGSDGAYPEGGVVRDAAGNLYGTTGGGGATCASGTPGCGTIFKVTHGSGDTWSETVLYDFQNIIGYSPTTPLLLDSSGNMYGTALNGGTNGYGMVFEFSPNQAPISNAILPSPIPQHLRPTLPLRDRKTWVGALPNRSKTGGR
jgi:uncharacterized repeat protein (TIGR03803 family)